VFGFVLLEELGVDPVEELFAVVLVLDVLVGLPAHLALKLLQTATGSTPSSSNSTKPNTTTALAKVQSTPVIPGIEKTSGATPSVTGPTDSSNYLSGSPTSSQQ